MKKYELILDDSIDVLECKLFRIRALTSFGNVKAGGLGGYIQKEENLSHDGNAWVFGNAKVFGNAEVYDNARINSQKDYIVFKNHWSSGCHFTYTKSNKMWRVGCFYGTGQELIEKAYADSEKSGNHYKAYVDFVEMLDQISE